MSGLRRLAEWFMPSDPIGRELQRDQLLIVVRSSSRSFPASCIANAGAGLVALQWQPASDIFIWMSAMLAMMGLSRIADKTYLAQSGDLKKFPRLALMCLSVSGLTMAIIAAGAVMFWEPGVPVNHLFVLLMMTTSAAIGTVYTAPYAPIATLQGIYVGTAVGLCFSEGSFEYLMIGGMGFAIAAMMVSVGFAINEGARQILSLRYSERDLVAQLRDANLAKSAFLANMSHELRTPLNAVIGFSDVMRQELLGPVGTPAYIGYAEDIHVSGTHLLTLINQVLDLSKIEAGKYELRECDVELNTVVDEAIRMVAQRAAEGGVTIVNDVPRNAIIRADATALRQVALNVAMNAVKFTPAGGKIRAFGTMLPDGRLAIGVRDTGCGIRPEDIEAVFENFGQARHDVAVREKGTGLGLPIVRSLMRAHGGDAIIESKLGTGTTVYLTLPRERVVDFGLATEPLAPASQAA